jgi:hypothetical protein
VKAFHVRRQPLTGGGTESGKSNHFSKSSSTRLRVLRSSCRAGYREINQGSLAKRSPSGRTTVKHSRGVMETAAAVKTF